MTVSAESVLISKILKRHGARPDLRLWRNETAVAWVGKKKGTTPEGHTVLFRGARRILAGLCVGSADLIGIKGPTPGVDVYDDEFEQGIFIAIEVKTGKTTTKKEQHKFLDIIKAMGGIAGIARSVEDVDNLLGEPPNA